MGLGQNSHALSAQEVFLGGCVVVVVVVVLGDVLVADCLEDSGGLLWGDRSSSSGNAGFDSTPSARM